MERNKALPLSIISKYRTELMGYAMIGVLIGHIIVFGHIQYSGLVGLANFFAYLIHTSGFLFLSGFGLYFSLDRDRNTWNFYKRRFYRFLLPFLLLAIPYFLIYTIYKNESVWFYIRCITTLEFWVSGNYHGMWYIAVSLLLYILFPSIFKWGQKDHYCIKMGLIIAAVLVICIFLGTMYPGYWDKIEIGFPKIVCFFLGSILGCWAKNNLVISRRCTYAMVAVLCVYGIFTPPPIVLSCVNMYTI